MKADELRASILQAAIQGKLVPQNPDDEPASVLVEHIREEKHRLIKEGKMKKQKGESFIFRRDGSWFEIIDGKDERCIDDEIPFDIPDNWTWIKSINLVSFNYGYPFDSSKFNTIKRGTPLIRIRDLLPNRTETYTTEIVSDSYLVHDDDLLIGMDGNFNCVFWSGGDAYLNQRVCRVVNLTPYFSLFYLKLYLETILTHISDDISYTTVQHLSDKQLRSILIPLPPEEEQNRIIKKIKILFDQIRRFNTIEITQSTLISTFPSKMRSSVLQAAIQGKLVPQDPDDEPASVLVERIRDEKHRLIKEGKMKKQKGESFIFRRDGSWFEIIDGKDERCIDDEIPFDIPENWTWARTNSICSYIHRGKSPIYSNEKIIPVFAQKCNQPDGLHLERCLFLDPCYFKQYDDNQLLQNKDLLINSTGLGTLGRIGIYNTTLNKYGIIVADSHVTVLRTLILPEYLFIFYRSPEFQLKTESLSSGSTKQKELSTKTIENILISIPPFEEQKRIVYKATNIINQISLFNCGQ